MKEPAVFLNGAQKSTGSKTRWPPRERTVSFASISPANSPVTPRISGALRRGRLADVDAGYLPSRAPSHEGAFGDKIYGRYGFTDAFRPTNGWASSDVLGLDVGITLLSAENLRSGNIWKWFMLNAEIPRAMRLAGM